MPYDPDDGGQPPEWEKFLEDVTVPREAQSVLFDPSLMETVLSDYSTGYAQLLARSPTTQVERWAELERLRAIGKRKLTGQTREAMLLLLSGEHSYREVARLLGMSKDAVRRHVQKAGKIMQEHLERPTKRTFPVEQRGGMKAAVLPLDTEKERKAFVRFINQHSVAHVAYGGEADFREALVLYS